MQDDRELIGASFLGPLLTEVYWKQDNSGEILLTEIARFAQEETIEGSSDHHLLLPPGSAQAAIAVLQTRARKLPEQASPTHPLRTLLSHMYKEWSINRLEELHDWLTQEQVSHEWLSLLWQVDPHFPQTCAPVQNPAQEIQQALQMENPQDRRTFLRGKCYRFGLFEQGWDDFCLRELHLASNGAIRFQFNYDFQGGVEFGEDKSTEHGYSKEACFSHSSLTILGPDGQSALQTFASRLGKSVPDSGEQEIFLIDLFDSFQPFLSGPQESSQGLITMYRWLNQAALPCILSRHKGRPFVWY